MVEKKKKRNLSNEDISSTELQLMNNIKVIIAMDKSKVIAAALVVVAAAVIYDDNRSNNGTQETNSY